MINIFQPHSGKLKIASARWVITGIFLLIFVFVLDWISARFGYTHSNLEKPVLWVVAVWVLTGAVFIVLTRGITRQQPKRLVIWIVLIGGVLFRLLTFAGAPILEDDFYRYLWDGAVTSQGINPYRYSPQEIMDENPGKNIQLTELQELSHRSPEIIRRINFPGIRTIYPPVGQVFFTIAYWLKPFSLNAWRFVLLLVDVLNVLLLLLLLNTLGRSPLWMVLYWWNPLVLKEIFNSAHMDILIFPFLLAAVYFSLNKKFPPAALFIGLAAGVKFWPIILLPILLRPLFKRPIRLVGNLAIITVIVGVMVLPIWLSGFDSTSAFANYPSHWEANDAVFKIFLWITAPVLEYFGHHPGYNQLWSRILAAGLVIATAFWQSLRPWTTGRQMIRKLLIVVSVLFLLSPTQFPWYFVWILPFLVLYPRLSLLSYTALLPLYLLRYYFEPRGELDLFNYRVVWLEHVPVLILLLVEWWKGRLTAVTELEAGS